MMGGEGVETAACMCEITQFIAVADVDMPFDKCIL